MDALVGIFVSIVLLIVMTWVAIFGGIGALLSHSRGGSAQAGLAWGAGLGPVGWLTILWTTRTRRAKPEPGPAFSARPSNVSTAHSVPPKRWDPWNK